MRGMKSLEIETLEPVGGIPSDTVPDVAVFEFHGKFILDPTKLKTQEDILKVIKHFSTRVELHVFEVEGIEQYVKPVSPKQSH